ncbi:MAG: GTPase Era [Christensenellaceae bacterium]|jgi:GTP-binding protein Era|nr:GTPase Era [Christensenellaceae bacterium]
MIEIYENDTYLLDIKAALTATLKELEIPENDVDVEIEFLDEEEMRELNKDSRGIDDVTDVLSFPATYIKFPFSKESYPKSALNLETNSLILGEICICLNRAKEQAIKYQHSVKREVCFLAVHGMLHLCGYSHKSDDDLKTMDKLQEKILDGIGITRDLEDNTKSYNTNNIDSEDTESDIVKTGYVGIIGPPNAGKSTLINALVGEKVSIVSFKPQTTRNSILGIMNTKKSQVMFLDTPGLHMPRNSLGQFMMRSVTSALESIDIILYMIDAEKYTRQDDITNIKRLILERNKKLIVCVNKIDHVTRELVVEILQALNPISGIDAVIPISALKKRNLDALKAQLDKLLHTGPREFDESMYTDRDMRFIVSETIREKTLRLLDKEIPFGIGVIVNKYEARENGIIDIDASIICQKATHKPIILGKGGGMLKQIGTYARQDLEKTNGSKIFLTLFVKIREDWRNDHSILEELGYTKLDTNKL